MVSDYVVMRVVITLWVLTVIALSIPAARDTIAAHQRQNEIDECMTYLTTEEINFVDAMTICRKR